MVGELLTLSRLESDARDPDQFFDLAHVVRIVAEDAGFEAHPPRRRSGDGNLRRP